MHEILQEWEVPQAKEPLELRDPQAFQIDWTQDEEVLQGNASQQDDAQVRTDPFFP
jgi:hypothetical protein